MEEDQGRDGGREFVMTLHGAFVSEGTIQSGWSQPIEDLER